MHVSQTVPSGLVMVVATEPNPVGTSSVPPTSVGEVVVAVAGEEVAGALTGAADGDDEDPPEPHATRARASTPASGDR